MASETAASEAESGSDGQQAQKPDQPAAEPTADEQPDQEAVESAPQAESSPPAESALPAESTESADDPSDKLNNILSLKVPVIVKVAERKMPMADILKFHVGGVIHFEKDAYQHVDLMVNNHTIGLGQPVKIGENFGLRIVEIRETAETIKSLGIQDPGSGG